ncbi:hypothetical protein psyc5s11_47390 [Clostridium gelidum]|uniref:Uncharacterized protein n=1 Tax=Clostridium gelidum TaxID=704125 RepID=A0ABM7TBC2_9CLOT|nr:hypothetical protein [Clostridium gelidum]BCZ48672.1 hypothetical protein psyc5s11_47390 [Clostridium gelidum]
MYTEGTTSYINKSFYEGISAIGGQTESTGLASIKEEYIAIDSAASGVDVNQFKSLATQPDALVEVGKLVFGENSNLDLPFVQNGREYTINLDANQTVDLAANAIKAGVNNLENLNKTFKLELKAEDIAQIKTEMNSTSFDTGLTEAKKALAGSTITSKDIFTDINYTSDCNINLQIKDFGKISIAVKATSTKSEVKAITLPTSKIKLTAEEFAKISAPTSTTIAATSNVVAK